MGAKRYTVSEQKRKVSESYGSAIPAQHGTLILRRKDAEEGCCANLRTATLPSCLYIPTSMLSFRLPTQLIFVPPSIFHIFLPSLETSTDSEELFFGDLTQVSALDNLRFHFQAQLSD